jgi:hypothetical protein
MLRSAALTHIFGPAEAHLSTKVMGNMTDHLLVAFDGGDSGTADLTWGQQDTFAAMRRENNSFSVGFWLPLADGTTVSDVADDLRFLMGRHQALRTRLGFAGDGRPQQVVAEAGEVPLEIVDAGAADPARVAEEVYLRYVAHVFDETREWPIRWAVVISGDVATHVVPIISHLVVDGASMGLMLAELAARDRVSGSAAAPVAGLRPLELARWQGTADGRRKSEAALRHWERLLLTIPARRFGSSPDRRQLRFWQLAYNSPASHLAARLIAARTRTSTSAVLLAAFAVAIAQVTGISPAVVQIMVSNRFRREMSSTISQLALAAPCVIDVAAASFDEVVRRAWQRVIGIYRLSYYDPVRREELIARISHQRGEQIDLSCTLNDRRAMNAQQQPAGDLPALEEVSAALERSKLTWGFQREFPGAHLFMNINNVPDTVDYEIYADTHHLCPADMEAFLRGQEAVLVEAALGTSGSHPVAARA